MTYNVNEIQNLLSFFNPEHFTDNDTYQLTDEISMRDCAPEFSWESGATKFVIIPENCDYVIKIPFNGQVDEYEEEPEFQYFYNGGGEEEWDYCDLEVAYYEGIIKEHGFQQFFLPLEQVYGTNWPVYVQQKAEVFEYSKTRSSAESLERVKSEVKQSTSLPDEWLAVCLDNLNGDMDRLNKLVFFLRENFYDLHCGNIGYLNGQAVIIDYAGYND